ncbi:anti sigma factor C-terminal domain-containing protein [Clostridium uliginosum]|uniref:Sigma factor regulator N-terminal n=1 Tax=Clostridium uliginosum TaxID=119641 RepID=A0A1I1RYK0_9CLOT|nr:anti sigma factor C-terminal domain-containing protein [Clostridium uliginosum]SFD39361.1 Sigma factor regulator N-terminal [Clostridium uliginosum]
MDKNIDDIFSDKMENEIKNEIRVGRNKLNRKLIIKSIIITLLILLIGNIAIKTTSDKCISYFSTKDREVQDLAYRVMNPNEYIGATRYRGTGYFSFESTYDISRKISAKNLYAGEINNYGGIGKNNICGGQSEGKTIRINDDITQRSNTVYGLRKLYFAYPYVDYENLINDFHILNEIEDNKVLEMAISFDKEYSYEEVNNMIDKNLITFYWVDNKSDEQKENNKNSQFKELVQEDMTIGIKSNNRYGEIMYDLNDRKMDFIDGIRKLQSTDYKDLVKNIDENNIKINGVVVVGAPSEINKLANTNFIKNAVMGSVVDKY